MNNETPAKKFVIKNTKRNLRCVFTDIELLAQGKALAEFARQAVQLEEEKKRITDDYKAKLSSVAADMSIMANNIRTGYEFRNVDCQEFWHVPPGRKTIERIDTREVVTVVDLTPEEMQQTLQLDNA